MNFTWMSPWEVFQFPFMQEALWVGLLVATACALLSCYLVLKGWSLMGDAISHAVLPGIVVAYAVGWPFALGAFLSGLLSTVSTGWIKANSRVKEDTVMGIVYTGLFALGLVMFSKIETDLHLNHVLFGNILGIEASAKWQTLVCCGLTLSLLIPFRKDLMLYCFDSTQAKVVGLNIQFLHYLLLVLLAATIVACLQAVGIILVIAMLVTPGCIAYLLTDRFDRMLLLAVLSSCLACTLGIYLSFLINGSTGACIVLAQAAIFTLTLSFAPKYGLLRRFSRGKA